METHKQLLEMKEKLNKNMAALLEKAKELKKVDGIDLDKLQTTLGGLGEMIGQINTAFEKK